MTSSGPAGSSLVLPAGCVSVPDAAREARSRGEEQEAPGGRQAEVRPDAFPVGGVRVGTHVARDGVQLDQLPGREADAARGGVA